MVGYQVKMIETGRYKTISEVEKIDGVDIFYMSDGTSCDSSSFKVRGLDELLRDRINLYCKDYAENFVTSLIELDKKNQTESNKGLKNKPKTFKIFGWTITLSKSK
jgi:hypothetical protein